MPYIIDGHNLIPKIPGLSLRAIDDEEQLIKVLQAFCRKSRKRAEVYFDRAPPGQPRRRKFGMVTAHFIRQGTTADAAICSRLRGLGNAARNWTVVTSDREVAAAAREASAHVFSSDEFADKLIEAHDFAEISPEDDENLALGSDAVEEWLRIFTEDKSK